MVAKRVMPYMCICESMPLSSWMWSRDAGTLSETPQSSRYGYKLSKSVHRFEVLAWLSIFVLIRWLKVRALLGQPLKNPLYWAASPMSFGCSSTHLKALFSIETALLLFSMCWTNSNSFMIEKHSQNLHEKKIDSHCKSIFLFCICQCHCAHGGNWFCLTEPATRPLLPTE